LRRRGRARSLGRRAGLDGARAECDLLVAVCEEAVAPWGERARVLKDAARFTVARKA